MPEEQLANVIVIKRDGKKVSFDGTKIAVAIKKGFDSIDDKYNEDDVNKIYTKVIDRIIGRDKIKIEEIQDLIEEELRTNNYEDVYQSFSDYRSKRAQSREIFFEEKRKHKFLKALEKLGLTTREKSEVTINDKNSNEIMEAYGKTVSEEFATSYLLKKKFADCHENGDIYINNLAYYPVGTTASVQMDVEKLLTDGFSTENCSMREPQSINNYAMLTIIALAENSKDQSEKQSIPAFDYYMAPGVLKTFKKEFRQTIYDILEYTDYDKFIAINGIEREIEKITSVDFDISTFYKFTRESESLKRMFDIVYNKALKKTENATYQAMEAFSHDINSMLNGKVTTVNLGTDTSFEGRMITKSLFRTIERGVGDHKKAASPVIVFKIKKGVNYNEKDPNYDLLLKACELTTKTDNIAFSFLDTTFNSSVYKEGDFNTEVAYFENGERVIDNFVDPDKEVASGRGVLSTTSLNLARIALKNRDSIEDFYEELDQKLELIQDQLLERLEIQNNKKAFNFPFLMKQNVWIDSEKLKEDDKVKRVLKHGNMRIAFTGLEEAVIALTGSSLLDSKKAQELGIEIVTHMREKTNEFSKKHNLNFTLAGDNRENVAADFLDFDRVIFGQIKDVTDKDKYSLAFEVGDTDDVDKKIKIETPYHELTNGGHMLRLEIKNLKEKDVLELIKKMQDAEIGYARIKSK